MKNLKLFASEYRKFYKEIRARVISARISAARSIDREAIDMYWDIGKNIVEKQTKHKWGDSVVRRLSKDLATEFGDRHGFSPRNLWRMRIFYLAYKDNTKVARVVRLLSWGKNVMIVEKIKDLKEREYYIGAAIGD